jgi:hypothetical protein
MRPQGLTMPDGFWSTIGAGALGTLIGATATIIAAMISRQPTLAAMVDQRIRVLIEAYDLTIRDLRAEIDTLERKVDELGAQLREARGQRPSAAPFVAQPPRPRG